jgi:hypothetical protein
MTVATPSDRVGDGARRAVTVTPQSRAGRSTGRRGGCLLFPAGGTPGTRLAVGVIA